MARENQGLQIALIILVILVIMLGVTTFMFFKQAEEAEKERVAATEAASADKTAAGNLLTVANRLKEMVGVAATDELGTIDQEFNNDMTSYATAYGETEHNYRKMLKHLWDDKEKTQSSMEQATQSLKQANARSGSIEAEKQKQIDQYKKAADSAASSLAEARTGFTRSLQNVQKQNTDLQAKLGQAQKDAVAAVDEVQMRLMNLQEQFETNSDILKQRNEEVRLILKPTFERGDGKIRWVNQRNATVWIDLGQADALRRQITFSVYPADTNDVNRAGKKAEIEITELLGEHLAEARIISDDVSNPILPGDVIHTPVWAPAERLHFALTDGIDIDGNGKSDLETVRNLISQNGAVVDAWIEEDGTRHGTLNTKTRFVVVGNEQDATTDPRLLEERTRILKEADGLGIATMALPELLRQMGWKNQTPVVRYGRDANPADFRAKPPEGIPKVSSGTVSPLFQPREPPGRATAY